jgi:predicted  nucleic acid-binding Zn-ribbon protein
MRLRIGAVAALLLLAGCAREEDPAKAGFFSGLGNATTGTYERRLDDRQRELSETQQLKEQLAARAADSDRRRALSGAELQNRQARLASLDDDLGRMKRRLDELKRQRSGDQAQLRDAERRLAELRREREQAVGPADEAQIRDLEQRTRIMDRAIAGLGRPE